MTLTLLGGAFALWIVAVCLLGTESTWQEYYGDGPPYHGRTTNMDKWKSPVPHLLVLNGVGLGLIAGIGYGIWRLRRQRGNSTQLSRRG